MKKIKTYSRLSYPLLAASLFCCLPAAAAPAVDPKAQALLRQSAAIYQALHSFSCRIKTEIRIDSAPGSRVIKIKLVFQAPDKAAATVDKNDETVQYFSDGTSLYLYSPVRKQYLQSKMPLNASATAPVLTQGQSFQGLLLLRPAGLKTIAEAAGMDTLTVGPPEVFDGFAVRTVTKVTKHRDGGLMTMALTLGVKDHLVHRYVSTIQSPTPLMPKENDVRRIDNAETYSDIQVDPTLPASTFLPPPDAKKAEPDKQDQKQQDQK